MDKITELVLLGELTHFLSKNFGFVLSSEEDKKVIDNSFAVNLSFNHCCKSCTFPILVETMCRILFRFVLL